MGVSKSDLEEERAHASVDQQMLCIQKVPSLVPNNKAACGQNKPSGAKWISLVEDSNKCSDVKQRGEALGSLG